RPRRRWSAPTSRAARRREGPGARRGLSSFEPEFLRAQVLDAVADLGRALELQRLGRLAHGLLEGLDLLLDLVDRAVALLRRLLDLGHADVVRLVHRRQQLAQVLRDRLRGDPVLLVVGGLDPAAATGLPDRELPGVRTLVRVGARP